MSNSESTVLGAVIAALSLLVVAVISAVGTLRQEQRRRREERKETERLEIRRRAADVFTLMFAMQHEIEWITWHAANDPAALNPHMVDNYHRTIHTTYPKLLGAMAVVCAFDEELFHRLKPLTDDLYKLDIEVALATRDLRSLVRCSFAIRTLKRLHPIVKNLYEQLPQQMAQSMQLSAPSPRRKKMSLWHPRTGKT